MNPVTIGVRHRVKKDEIGSNTVNGWKARFRSGRRPVVAEAEMTGETERDP